MLRKPRPDSVIGSQLPPIIKDDVDAMLFPARLTKMSRNAWPRTV